MIGQTTGKLLLLRQFPISDAKISGTDWTHKYLVYGGKILQIALIVLL